MTNVAICGLGNIGAVHLENLLSLRGCRIAGLFDAAPEKLKAASSRFGLQAYRSFDELVTDKEVDAVVIATPSTAHLDLTLIALAQGKHVFVEKPLAATLEDSAAIVDAARKSGRVIQAGLCERFNPHYLEAKSAIRRGDLGEVRSITSSRIAPFAFGDPSWPLGTLDTAVHNLDLILWLSGATPVSVLAQGVQVYPDSNILHSVTIVIRFSNGALATDHVAWMREASHPLSQCARSRMVLMGDKGAFEIDLNTRPAALMTENRYQMCDTVILGGPAYYSCLKLQFEGFLRSIETGDPVLAPVDEALNAQRLVMAAAESLTTGASVAI